MNTFMNPKMTWKESIIFLQSQSCSYHFVFEYFKLGVTKHLTQVEIDEQTLRLLLEELISQVEGRRIKLPNLNRLLTNYDNSLMMTKTLSKQSFMIGDSIYPHNWLQLPQPPILVFYEGELACLTKPTISVIGTRAMSAYGREIVTQLVSEFVTNNWISVSGMAKGVDTAVHLTACQLKKGSSIGILANGFQYVYPYENMSLQAEMSMNHLLLSEYLPNVKARPHHFVMRNRLIAGLSLATIVIEAAKKSGSLITANYALQCNREVFVLPGRINDPQAYGCNSLIHHGAIPIVSIEECVEELANLFIKLV
ncbi:DNA-processing protein DprA [Fundicoccus sp. Sow4_D5]|uniref:DNA-processing protein DprA n=1 Tax=Fundicoccus sp. Sow4_D5 TaxID=3438782 RepID=UPI003F90B70E